MKEALVFQATLVAIITWQICYALRQNLDTEQTSTGYPWTTGRPKPTTGYPWTTGRPKTTTGYPWTTARPTRTTGYPMSSTVHPRTTTTAASKYPCSEFTVGNCYIDYDSLLWSSSQVHDNDLCQYTCSNFMHCLLFRQTDSYCQLLRDDFRPNCKIVGGPVDGSIAECVNSNTDGCNGMLEEDCYYNGRNLGLDPPAGEVVTAYECEALCHGFKELGCRYWVFDADRESCQLLASSSRRCYGLSGPHYPELSDC